MKKLHEKVNIIPVIGKADALSKTELKKFKGEIMRELMSNGVKIYEFPAEDDCSATSPKSTGVDLPFAVIGSREFVRVGSKTVRGRGYPWGNVLVENEAHCDFVKLREMLIRTNMEDLKEKTHQCHYEKYRRDRLIQMGFQDGGTSFQEMCQQKLHLQFGELAEIEEDLKTRMAARVRSKDDELKEVQRLLQEKFEQIEEDQLNEHEKLGCFAKQLQSDMALFRSLTVQYLSQQPQKKLASTSSSAFSLGSLGRNKKSS
jgi:septin family protein